jgi:hypothetical protein
MSEFFSIPEDFLKRRINGCVNGTGLSIAMYLVFHGKVGGPPRRPRKIPMYYGKTDGCGCKYCRYMNWRKKYE